jgi:hypothetical protein
MGRNWERRLLGLLCIGGCAAAVALAAPAGANSVFHDSCAKSRPHNEGNHAVVRCSTRGSFYCEDTAPHCNRSATLTASSNRGPVTGIFLFRDSPGTSHRWSCRSRGSAHSCKVSVNTTVRPATTFDVSCATLAPKNSRAAVSCSETFSEP